MKVYRITFILGLAFVLSQMALSQKTSNKSLKKSNAMEKLNTKEKIQFLYDSILNTKQFKKLTEVVSPDYTNQLGEKGIEGFKKSIIGLTTAFTNAHWKIEEIICEENKVVVKQRFTGTHTSLFQNIRPTNKSVSVDGIATYELKNGKIIHSQIQTDRLGFMQQLGIIPNKITPANESNVIFIDKFYVPKNSVEEFKTKMNSNSSFIKSIAGYVKGEAFEQVDENGNLTIITIATWENQDCLDKAKSIVQAEFKKNNFNPSEFYTRLEVKLDRGLYKTLLE